MLETKIVVVNRLGLHARAAAQLVRLASQFESRLTLRRGDNQTDADAKSILSVLTLAASKGVEMILEADGADEAKALRAVKELFERGFGEN